MEYDPILGKLIAAAWTREAARLRMIRALESYPILGIRTTIPFLIDVLKSNEFAKGNTDTKFVDRHFGNWSQTMEDVDLARIAYVADEFVWSAKPTAREKHEGWPSPWETLGDWRM